MIRALDKTSQAGLDEVLSLVLESQRVQRVEIDGRDSQSESDERATATWIANLTDPKAHYFVAGDDVIGAVAARCTEVESGARNVDNILTNTVLPDISRRLLGMMAEGARPERITIAVGADGGFQYE